MSAPERRYTDADVRADDELAEMAYEYVENYRGDFEPLVKAQDVLRRGSLLTTAQTRIVLNCMRNDWDIADKMPRPMAKVIDMPVRDTEVEIVTKRKRKNAREPRWQDRNVPCGDTSYHPRHNYEKDGFDYWHCDGLINNRQGHLFIPAKIKTPYVKAKGGKMIHLLGDGSGYQWTPNRYGDGFGGLLRKIGTSEADRSLWGRFPPTLHVKLLCKYPSWLQNPLLMWEIPDGLITNDGTPIGLCKYCEAVRDGAS